MKIIFAMWGTLRTGGTNAIFNVASELSRFGHEVKIISLGARDHMWFSFEPGSVEFLYPEEQLLSHSPIKFRNRSLGMIEGIDHILRKFDISIDRIKILARTLSHYAKDADAVIATMFETAFSVNRMETGKYEKFYYIQHFESVSFNDSYNQKRVHETYFFPFKWIVNSTWANSKLMELTGKSGNIVVPGIDSSIYYPRNVQKDTNHKVIVSLGKSMEIKGVKYLFQALSKLSKRIPNIKLVLYGVEPDLKKLSPIDTDYVISPSNEKLAELYSSADVVVTPSLYESSPSPPIEAMACGAPVVTTRYGTEDYCYDGENSLVVPPEDSNALAEAISRILEDESLAKRLRENGIIKSGELSYHSTASNFERVLREKLL